MPPSKPKGDDGRAWTKYMGLGAQLIATIGISVAIGLYLDGQFGTNPWITVAMSLLGVVGGLWVSIKDLL
ncbi:putative F0F1-ATPase subunit (Ca2+/Mg2+ transporter) [Neolewinella xylanilytica]|uniref:Putative F0F1-ATPase subunit (Ca2+/Mg2+ transporter) n=1 Tax=Neolewinella xylanilytica TaxID=1514080 RepID=A0A2S6I471_9BACT|nr:AtpZ/AtpI family protein [Neolewinella xylanilytica]PPK85861.1 putative F0F1-ATPase subunit (Ca2+/Mg2+ transporter) [Neolewinella xylanilytica]